MRHEPTLRSESSPQGIYPIPLGWEAYIAKHNLLAEFTSEAIRACHATATPMALENPASRSDPTSPAFWEEFQHHGSLWHMLSIATTLGAFSAAVHTFAQCALGAPVQKWTTISACGSMAQSLAGLGTSKYACHHGTSRHPEVISGRDNLGRSRTGLAAAYPEGLNTLLTRAIVEAATAHRASSQERPLPSPSSLPTVHEGNVR